MVKRILLVLQIVVNITIITIALLWEGIIGKYLYPSLEKFNPTKWMILIIALVIFNLTLISIVKFCTIKQKIKRIVIPLLSVFLIFGVWLMCAATTLVSIGNWCSKTDDEDNFGQIDKRLDDEIDVAGLKLSHIMEIEREWVDNYNYYYILTPTTGQFNISFDVKFTPDTYQKFKNHLEKSKEMERVYCTEWSRSTGEEKTVSIVYAIRENKTQSVFLHWERMNIAFDDKQNICYFELIGYYDT